MGLGSFGIPRVRGEFLAGKHLKTGGCGDVVFSMAAFFLDAVVNGGKTASGAFCYQSSRGILGRDALGLVKALECGENIDVSVVTEKGLIRFAAQKAGE